MQQIILFINKYSIFFFIGCITALSQAPFNMVICSLIGFSSLFYFIIHKENISYFLAGHLFGFGYFLTGLHWIGNALLTDISQFALFLPFAYLGLPFVLGFFYAVSIWLYGTICYYIWGRNSGYISKKFFIFFIMLGLFDYIRGYIFTGFPWNLPIYTTVSANILMQPVYYLGTYCYNLLWLLFVGSFGLYFLKLGFRKSTLVTAQIICIAMICGYGYWHIHYDNKKVKSINQNIIVRIVQPNIEQKLKWSQTEAENNFQKLLNISYKNLDNDKKYIFIWPETALPFHPEYNFSVASQIMDLLQRKHRLITGKMRFIEKNAEMKEYEFYNSIFKITSDGKIKSVFDKVHLVPFGEYLPLRPILSKIGFSQVNFFKSEFSTGKNFKSFKLIKNIRAGGLICYEAIFPKYASEIKQNKGDLIINVTNDAWFGDSFGPHQHLVQTQFRAVENNIPIIRAANTGISSFINKEGKIVKFLPLNKAGFIDIPLNELIKN